jgi:hypothetical protein
MSNKQALTQDVLTAERLQAYEHANGKTTATTAAALSSLTEKASRPQSRKVQVCISLLGEMKMWLDIDGKQIELPIKSNRRQELFAYIATLAPDRSKRVSSGRIITDVFEHIAPTSDVSNLRLLFQKHTQLLRKEINELASQADIPKLPLFQYEKIDNKSTKWWLSAECKVVDLEELQHLYEQMEAAEEQPGENASTLEALCMQLINLYQSYQGDYLEQHVLNDEFGDAEWVRVPFTEYKEMYLRAIWNVSLLHHTLSMRPAISDQQRYKSAKKALQYYKLYALYAPKHRRFDINARKSRRQSERALRGHLRMCRWLMDAQTADGTYSAYEKLMSEEYPEWKPNASTIEILRVIRQQSDEHILTFDQLEPPEEKEE